MKGRRMEESLDKMAAPSIVFLSQSDRNTQNIYAIQCFIFLFFFLYFFLTEKAELGLVS